MFNLDRNKANVISFYELMFNECRPREAVDRYVGDEYLLHNPRVAAGKRGVIDHFQRIAQEWPGKCAVVKRAFAEGDFVVLHCTQHGPGDRSYMGVDIFRLTSEGKIVEHWDVVQAIPGHLA